MPVSPEVEAYLANQGDEDTAVSPEVAEYLKRAGLRPLPKPTKPRALGEAPGGPTKPKPSKIEPSTQPFGGTGRTWEPEKPGSLLERMGQTYRGIAEGDTNPDEHLEGYQPPSPVRSVEFRPVGVERQAAAKVPAAGVDVTRVAPRGSVKSEQERINAPQKDRETAARSMRETQAAGVKRANQLAAAGDAAGAEEAGRQARNAGKAADALERTAGPLASMASAFGESLGMFGGKDPNEHENRIIQEAAQPGMTPTPKEQVAHGVRHPGGPIVAPAMTSPEGLGALAGQLPAFESFAKAGTVAGGLLGDIAEGIGAGRSVAAPAARAVSRGVEAVQAASTIPEAAPFEFSKAGVKAEVDHFLSAIRPRLTKGLTSGAEGVFGVSYSSARSQGKSPQEALEIAIKSVPENIPFALGMEVGGAVLGPLGRIGKEGVRAAASTEATPMVEGMRRARDAQQLPNIPEPKTRLDKETGAWVPTGAKGGGFQDAGNTAIPRPKTKYDTPEVLQARAAAAAHQSTHLIDTPERKQWRAEAQRTHFENAKAYAPNGEPEAGKQAFILIGPPGAGKSSIIREIAEQHKALVTDSDDAKKLAPELQADPSAAFAVHLESAKINAKVLKQAVKQGLNFVWPTVGSNAPNLGQQIHELKGAGYTVHLRYVGAPTSVAIPRMMERWKAGKQGFLDPTAALSLRGIPFATFRTLAKHKDVSSYEEYDNSVNGQPPRLVRSSAGERAPVFTQEHPAAAGPGVLARGGEGGARRVPGGDGSVARATAEIKRAVGPQEHLELHAPADQPTVQHQLLKALDEMAPHAVYSREPQSVEEWVQRAYTYTGNQHAADQLRQLLGDRDGLTLAEVRAVVAGQTDNASENGLLHKMQQAFKAENERPGSLASAGNRIEMPHHEDDSLVGRMRRMAAEATHRASATHVPEAASRMLEQAQPITPLGNVEMMSDKTPGMRDADLDAHPPALRRTGFSLFINRVIRPIVRSEGLPDHVTKGLGSWFGNGTLALHEGGTVRFPKDVTVDQVHRVLARVSEAARQNGYFAAIPDANGTRLAIELDFGRPLKPAELSESIRRLSAADNGDHFSGSTMRDLSPARIQIVLNEGATKEDAAKVLDLAHQILAEPGDRGSTGRFRGLAYAATVADGFDPERFSQVVADRGGLSPSQLRADRSAQLWYRTLATASRTVGKARELAHDLHHATAPHQSLALDALGKYGMFLPPLAAAALPGSNDDKAKRAALASVFLAPRYRREILSKIKSFREDPVYSTDYRNEPRGWTDWAHRLDLGYDIRSKVGSVLKAFYKEHHPENAENVNGLPVREQVLTLDEVEQAINEVKVPERGVPFVSRLRKFITATPAESPRALGKAWDEPKPVADWIGKITNGAAQAGVKKEEIQLLVSALKGEPVDRSPLDPLDGFDALVRNSPTFGTTARMSAHSWAESIARTLRGPGPTLTPTEIRQIVLRLGGDYEAVMTGKMVRDALSHVSVPPAGTPRIPAKLTRADILKILDERLPQIERVVLGEKPEEEPDFADTVNHRDANYIRDADPGILVPVNEVERKVSELPWEAREDWLRSQVAARTAAKQEQLAEIRKNRVDADIDTSAHPEDIVEAQGWDPNAMEAHASGRRAAIEEIQGDIDRKIAHAADVQDTADDTLRQAYRHLSSVGGDADRVEDIVQNGWQGDGFARDTIDDAIQAATEDIETPDYDPIDLLRDNGYEVKDAPHRWVLKPREDQGALFGEEHHRPGPVEYTPEQVQEFLAREHNAQVDSGAAHDEHTGRTPHLDPDDFDADDISDADVLRLYRSEHGNVPVTIELEDSGEYVIVSRRSGKVEERGWRKKEPWRGDDERQLAYEFIGENSLDQGLNDEAIEEVTRAVRSYIDAYKEWAEAESEHDLLVNDEEYGGGQFETEREQIEEHERAIELFEEAKEHPLPAPADIGERGKKVEAATKRFNALNDEIDRLIEIGRKAQQDRKRLSAGTEKKAPSVQGESHYRGTQVSPGPSEDYAELIPIWANAPSEDFPIHTHFSGHGLPDEVGHQRVSTHLHYEIPDLNAAGKIELKNDSVNRETEVRYNLAVDDRIQSQHRLAAIERALEPLDRIGMDNLTPEQEGQARSLARNWQEENSILEGRMAREAKAIVRIAKERGLKPVKIRILEENQADPAQHAARTGVDRGPGTGSTPANPFMTGGTKKKTSTGRDGEQQERWDVNGDLSYRLGALNALADAIERDEQFFGWQDADTASAVHNFRRKAAKHVYEEVTPAGVRDGLRFAGVPEKDIPKPEHMTIAGAGHWVIKLTPEIKAAVKKVGLPIMGLLALAATPKPASAQQQAGAEEQDEPESNLGKWILTGVGAAIALSALAFAKRRSRSGAEFPEDIREVLDEAESLVAKRKAGRDLASTRGEGYKAAFAVEDTPGGNGPAHFRLGKLGLSKEGEDLFRRVVGDPGLKRRISHETAIDVAKIRRLSPETLLMKEKWDGIDAVAGSQFISEATGRLGEISDELEKEKDPAKQRQLTLDYARLVADVTDIANKATGERAEAGRTLNFYKIAAKTIGVDPQAWAMLARRAKGTPLTDPEMRKIFTLLKMGDRLELSAFVNGMRPSTAAQRFAEGLRMSMLSSWTTLEKITLSHAVSELRRAAMHPLSVGLDYLLAAAGSALDAAKKEGDFSKDDITMRRTMALSVRGQGTARVKGVKRGWRQAVQTLQTGASEEEVGRLDNNRVNFRSPFMQAAQRLVYGMHALGYTPFREGHFEVVLNELAFVEARRLHILSPVKSVDRIRREILANPAPGLVAQAMEEARRRSLSESPKQARLAKRLPDKDVGMAEWAAQAADEAVFQNTDSLLGAVARGARRGAETSPIGTVATAFLFPFSTIPANIATRLVDSTPLGIVTALVRQMGDVYDQRRLANDIAYSLTGTTGMLGLGYMLYHKGILTGLAPDDPGQRRTWAEEGKQPLSVKIKGNWYSLADLGPEGMALALGATWYQLGEDEPSLMKKVMKETGAVGAVVAEAPFISGIREAAEVMTDPVRHGEGFVKSLASSLVPAAIRRTAHFVDPVIRDTESPLDADKASLPGISRTLPARVTRFGEVAKRTKAERLGEVLSPSRVRTQSTDPVLVELDRLKVGLPNTRLRVFDDSQSRPTTSEERREEKISVGPILKRAYQAAIDHPAYADLPDETKKDLLDKVGRLPADAVRYVGARRADATAPTDMVETHVQSELRQLMAKAVSEANTGIPRLSSSKRPSASVVPAGTEVSPEVAAYLRQQRIDARRPAVRPP